ncbi:MULTISPECIES: CHC2 zinc finger domain-containing protein [Oceanobacillus]|uniref:CHC2 zinc finger domain-containing protein n=1 Tax=Oceanobacillus TaxID=182709 RepID=UPI000595BD94|nr:MULTISPECIES: CHC2 zinc finger domain-containing protein [Oceanobacillus]
MLPNILDIAQACNVEIDSKTYGKKETRAKCPFCQEDAKPEKRKKFYLSLNTQDQVYRCFFCGEKGGVLKFEANLTQKSFTEVKEKYFGKNKKSLHPAYQLNAEQLSRIGWQKYKRNNFKDFLKNREQVENDWNQYVYTELVKYYALFLCINQLNGAKKIEAMKWFVGKCRELPIPKMYERIINQHNKEDKDLDKWAITGKQVARIAWKVSIKTVDIKLNDLFINILLADFFYKKVKIHSHKRRVSQKNNI